MRRIQLLAVGLCLLMSTAAWAELRVYDVDFEYRQEVYQALRNVLVADGSAEAVRRGTAMYGRVELLPSGQLLVDATPGTHEQVERVLRTIRERPVGGAPRVSLRYWAVLGTERAENVPGTRPVPSVLNDVLAELQRFHGELAFRLMGTATLVTESGQKGEVRGRPMGVEQLAYVQGQTLNADVAIQLTYLDTRPNFTGGQFNTNRLNVRATLGRGEFVVLGESTLQGGEYDGTLFYIVHWPEND